MDQTCPGCGASLPSNIDAGIEALKKCPVCDFVLPPVTDAAQPADEDASAVASTLVDDDGLDLLAELELEDLELDDPELDDQKLEDAELDDQKLEDAELETKAAGRCRAGRPKAGRRRAGRPSSPRVEARGRFEGGRRVVGGLGAGGS